MNHPYSLTLEQVDTINLSLARAMAIVQMLAECGPERRREADEPTPASLFVVMQVVQDELEQVQEVMGTLRKEGQTA
ncbi:MAG: hypothetical protein HQL76_17915 [Magnetococcales bacterium]|nr:hypothetical protein [Magnetococcales bacterium]